MNTFEMDCMKCPRLWTKAWMIFNCIWTTHSLKSIPFFEQIMVNWNKNCLIPWISQEWLSRTDWLSCLRQLLWTTWLKLFRVSLLSSYFIDLSQDILWLWLTYWLDLFLLSFFTKQNSTRFKLIFESCLRRRMSFEMHYIFSRQDFIGQRRFVSQFSVTKGEGDPSSLFVSPPFLSFFSTILRLYRSLTRSLLMSCFHFFLVIVRRPLFLSDFIPVSLPSTGFGKSIQRMPTSSLWGPQEQVSICPGKVQSICEFGWPAWLESPHEVWNKRPKTGID